MNERAIFYRQVVCERIKDKHASILVCGGGKLLRNLPNAELIWASPRELLNIFQADEIGCHIITVTNDILKKLPLVGKDLSDYSLDTVKLFYSDAQKADYRL